MSRLGLADYNQWMYPKKTNAKCTNNCGTVGSFNDIMSKMLVGLNKWLKNLGPCMAATRWAGHYRTRSHILSCRKKCLTKIRK